MGYPWKPTSSFWELEEDLGPFPVLWASFPCGFTCWVSPEVVTQDKGSCPTWSSPWGWERGNFLLSPCLEAGCCRGKGTMLKLAWISPFPSPACSPSMGSGKQQLLGGISGQQTCREEELDPIRFCGGVSSPSFSLPPSLLLQMNLNSIKKAADDAGDWDLTLQLLRLPGLSQVPGRRALSHFPHRIRDSRWALAWCLQHPVFVLHISPNLT